MRLRDDRGRFVKKYQLGGPSNTRKNDGYGWNAIMENSDEFFNWVTSYDKNNYGDFNTLQDDWLNNYNNSNFKNNPGSKLNYDRNVFDRQAKYHGLNFGLNNVIERAIGNGLLTRAGITGDNAAKGYQDGYFGYMENLRHGGAKLGNDLDVSQETIDKINAKLKEKKLVYKLSTNGMYHIEELHDEEVPLQAEEKPQDLVFGEYDPFSNGNNAENNPEKSGKKPFSINKTQLANSLELLRLGTGLAVNNKVAQRALDAEKPLLLDPIEHHRSVYGDLRSKMQGQEAAAQLNNAASRPLTSDASLQTAQQLEAQSKGQLFIEQGNLADDAMMRQTGEVAWQQEKENAQVRHQVAMQNRQALLETQKNISNIKNIRDSANYSLVIAPYLGGWEQRFRNEGVKQEAYDKYYQEALAQQNVFNQPDFTGWTSEEKDMWRRYMTQPNETTTYLSTQPTDAAKLAQWNKDWNSYQSVMQKLKTQTLRAQAAVHGVNLNILPLLQGSSAASYAFNVQIPGQTTSLPSWYIPREKQGGQIYKAKLSKRAKDNDRGSKSIEKSKELAAKFLEQSIDALYTYPEKKKRKKRRYQAGGGLPLVNFTPIFATSEDGIPLPSKETKSSKSEDLTTKDVLQLLKDMDALPSDILQVVSQLKNFEITEQLDPLGLTGTSGIASRYMKLISQIKTAKFNKDEYNKARDLLIQNGGINEYAVTSEGYVLAMNTAGNIVPLQVSDVLSGEAMKEGYQPITNGNLLALRAEHSDLAFNQTLLHLAYSGIGMEAINKWISDVISGLGKTKESQETYEYINKDIIDGIGYLRDALKTDGVNSSTSMVELVKRGILTEDQAQQALLAKQYIWNTLPQNMKSLLLLKGGGKEGAQALLTSFISSKTSMTKEIKIGMLKDPNSPSSSKVSKETGLFDKMKMDPVTMLQAGYGEKQTITIQTNNSGMHGLEVPTVRMPIVTKDGKSIGVTNLNEVAQSAFAGYLDFENASMGGVMINPMGMDKIAINGTALYTGYLPVDMQEFYMTGNIKPDIEMLGRYKQAQQEIKENNISDPSQINEIYSKYQLPVMFDPESGAVLNNYRKFGMINANALKTAFTEEVDLADYVSEVTDENEIQNTISVLQKGRSKEERIDFDSKSWLDSIFGTDYDRIYAGTVFIPVNEDYFTGVAATGNYPEVGLADKVKALQQAKEKQSTYINPGQLEE